MSAGTTSAGRSLPPGLYRYDDLAPGDVVETPGIVVSEAQIVAFAGLSGDFYPIHMDDEAARAAGFPGRVAHGLLVLSLVDGLKNRAEARFDAIASLGWDWRFAAPVFAGDRIAARIVVERLRPTSDPARGIAVLALSAMNREGRVVQQGRTTLMLRRR